MRIEIDSDHRYTPRHIWDLVAEVFDGEVVHDLTTCTEAMANHEGRHNSRVIAHPGIDIFDQNKKYRNIFMNPPFSRKAGGIGAFIDKARELCCGRLLVLVNSDNTSSAWMQQALSQCEWALFLKKRIQFEYPERLQKQNSPMKSQVLLMFHGHNATGYEPPTGIGEYGVLMYQGSKPAPGQVLN